MPSQPQAGTSQVPHSWVGSWPYLQTLNYAGNAYWGQTLSLITNYVNYGCKMFYDTGPRCQDKPFRVYVYPLDEHVPPSESYSKILNTLKDSNYYTTNPEEACLFVLSLDTLDRDPLSNFDFVRNMPSRIAKLEHWNGGKVFFWCHDTQYNDTQHNGIQHINK